MRENSGHGDGVRSEEVWPQVPWGVDMRWMWTQGSERIVKLVAPLAPTLAETRDPSKIGWDPLGESLGLM